VWLTNPSTLLQWGAPLWNVGEGSEHKGGRNQDAVRRWIRAEKGNFKFAPSSAVARLWSLKRCDRRSSAAPFWDRAKEARTKRAGISDTACRWIRAEKSNPDFPRAPKDERASPTPLPTSGGDEHRDQRVGDCENVDQHDPEYGLYDAAHLTAIGVTVDRGTPAHNREEHDQRPETLKERLE
jgi:hypothetical protein